MELKVKMANDSSISVVVPKKQNLLKLMTGYDAGSDVKCFRSLFEREIIRIDISKEDWVTYSLPLEIVKIVARDYLVVFANEYDHVNTLLLKRFKLNPEQFKQKFVSQKKD